MTRFEDVTYRDLCMIIFWQSQTRTPELHCANPPLLPQAGTVINWQRIVLLLNFGERMSLLHRRTLGENRHSPA